MKGRLVVLAALALVLCLNAYAGQKFQFAVIGDRTGDADQKLFEQVIEEIAGANPDFAINVGDLIQGYTPDSNTVYAQWDTVLNTLQKLDCPIHYVAGNHDIFDEQSAVIYETRTGCKPYYSFDYENAHFIILSNAMPESWTDVEGEQLSWLKKDLAEHKKADPIFCFFHKPFWFEALEKNEEDQMHEILRAGGADCVISGHQHQFCRASWDGVKYIVIGSSGGGKGVNEAAGDLYGYALVTVEGRRVETSLIEMGNNLLPNNALSFEDVKTARKIQEKHVRIEPVDLRDGVANVQHVVAIKVDNIRDEDFLEPISWASPNPAWRVFPEEKVGHFPARLTASIHFGVETSDLSCLYPLPQFSFTYPTEGWGECKIEAPLPVVRSVLAAKIENAPAIDGKLDDQCWTEKRKMGVLYGQGGGSTKVEPTQVYVAHDDRNLYLGVRCVESEKEKMRANTRERDVRSILGDDCILVYFDWQNRKERIHQLILTPVGQILDQQCTIEGQKINRDLKWNGDWKISLGEEENAWIAEIGIPFVVLEAKVEPGSVWGFNIGRIQPRLNDSATWQRYLSVHPDAYGKLVLE